MFDKIIHLLFASVSYCAGDQSAFWNQALVNQVLDQKQLKLIEATLNNLKRRPAVYFENKGLMKPLIEFLLKNNFECGFEDCWLFHPGVEINRDSFDQVKKILTERELEIFLATFDRCFQKDDPQNPYGELGDYLKVAKKVWQRHHATGRIEYFLVYDGNKPVAVSTLTNHKKIGYISNVGSLKSVRGRGFGKLATLYCVDLSKKRGNQYHCLATEDGTYPHEFYQHIGFVKKFSAACYVAVPAAMAIDIIAAGVRLGGNDIKGSSGNGQWVGGHDLSSPGRPSRKRQLKITP
jgi:ribosomal protein S18 acetylase RimI-like enzyme